MVIDDFKDEISDEEIESEEEIEDEQSSDSEDVDKDASDNYLREPKKKGVARLVQKNKESKEEIALLKAEIEKLKTKSMSDEDSVRNIVQDSLSIRDEILSLKDKFPNAPIKKVEELISKIPTLTAESALKIVAPEIWVGGKSEDRSGVGRPSPSNPYDQNSSKPTAKEVNDKLRSILG